MKVQLSEPSGQMIEFDAATSIHLDGDGDLTTIVARSRWVHARRIPATKP